MAFQAGAAVEELSYDFNPHTDVKGTIPEPTSQQVEEFQKALTAAFRGLGLTPEEIASNQISPDKIDDLLAKSKEAETEVIGAVANLTGIAQHTLAGLPYRIKIAFVGWIVGQFKNPQL